MFYYYGLIEELPSGGATTHPQAVSVSCTTSAAFVRSPGKLLSIASASATSLARSATKSLAVACSSSTTAAAIKVILATISVACSSSVALSREIGKQFAISSATAITFAKTVAHQVALAPISAVSLTRSVGKALVIACRSSTTAAAVKVHLVTIVVSCASSVASIGKSMLRTIAVSAVSAVASVASFRSSPGRRSYDLSGFSALQSTIAQMAADQAVSRTKFAGGFETWLPSPTGIFLATVAIGGSLVATTTNAVRAMITTLGVTFDLVAADPASSSAVTSTSAPVPGLPLATGRSGALGPAVYAGTAQATNYDLSGVAALQATVNAMLADRQSGVTNFEGSFQAILASGGSAQTFTIQQTRALLKQLRLSFDRLAQ